MPERRKGQSSPAARRQGNSIVVGRRLPPAPSPLAGEGDNRIALHGAPPLGFLALHGRKRWDYHPPVPTAARSAPFCQEGFRLMSTSAPPLPAPPLQPGAARDLRMGDPAHKGPIVPDAWKNIAG